MVSTLANFSRGIIEGFFGRPWSWQTRQAYASFLKQNNYQYYIYAPKADRYLRRQWSKPWPAEDHTNLQQLSQVYPATHLQDITAQLGRKPFIWDNYPVNDGAKLCKFLHLRPFGEPADHLATWTAGQAINPMNQAYLSQIPLMTLTANNQSDTLHSAACALGGETFVAYLVEDIAAFQDRGLDQLSAERKKESIDRYASFQTPYSQELVDWLQGEYPFDPACLTD